MQELVLSFRSVCPWDPTQVVRLAAATFDQQALCFCLRKGSCFISLFQCRGLGHEHARPPQPVPETQTVFNSTKCTTWDFFFFLILSMYVWDKCNLEMRHAKRLPTGQTVLFHRKRACPALHQSLGFLPNRLGVVAPACNPSTWEMKGGGDEKFKGIFSYYRMLGQPGTPETLSQIGRGSWGCQW